MSAARAITVSIIGNAEQLRETLNGAAGQTESFAKRAGKVAKAASIAVGAGMVAMLKSGVEGLLEGQAAEDKFTDALSRSNAAMKKSQEGIQALGEEIQKKTKFSYEDVLAVGTVIAKHKTLSDVVAKGVMSAEEMTKTTLDMATVMGVDGAAAADVLNKALLKPEAASKALMKAGIALTDGEKKKIKSMVEAGDAAGAQALILDKLKAKTEGAAEAAGNTMAGKMERAKNAFGEVQESLAVQLIPVLTKLMAWFQKITAWMQDNPGKMKALAIIVGGLAASVWAVTVATKVWTAATTVATAAQKLFNLAMKANPAMKIVAALTLVVAGVVAAYKKFEWFRYGVNGIIKALAGTVLWWIDTVWLGSLQKLVGAMGKLPGPLGAPFRAAEKAIGQARDKVGQLRSAIANLPTSKSMEYRVRVGMDQASYNRTMQQIRDMGFSADQARSSIDRMNAFHASGQYGPTTVDGARAAGGPVLSGNRYLVGERGPEILTMGSGSGFITPNHRIGGTQTVRVVLDVTGADHDLRQMIKKMIRNGGVF